MRGITFYIEQSSIVTEVFPVNDTILFSDEKDDDFGFYRRVIEEGLIFQGADYQYLKAVEVAGSCTQLPIYVRKNGVTKYTALLKFRTAAFEWLNDVCQVIVKPEPSDNYTCLLENWEKEINILQDTPKVSVNLFAGQIEEIFCTDVRGSTDDDYTIVDVPLTFCVSGQIGWTLVEHFTRQEPVDEFGNQTRFYSSRYVREKITLAPSATPPGDGWILLTDNSPTDKTWVRVPNISAFTEYQVYDDVVYVYFNRAIVFGEDLQSQPIDNGVRLNDVLSIFNPCDDLGIVSNLFGILPDGTNPTNDVYNYALANLQDVLIFQKSDVRTPFVSNNATIGRWTYEEILEQLQRQPNIEIRIEGTIDKFMRIEHTSYFQAQQGLDLTTPQYEKYIGGLNTYRWDGSKIARSEKWKFMESVSSDFEGVPIEYDCYGDEDVEEINHPLTRVNNDIGFIVTYPDKVADDGFVFVNAYNDGAGNYYVRGEYSALTGDLLLNGGMSIPNLLDKFHRHKRPLITGKLNNTVVNFESAIKRKIQPEISLPMSSNDYFDLDASELINTQLGWGEVEKQTYDVKNCYLDINLNHD